MLAEVVEPAQSEEDAASADEGTVEDNEVVLEAWCRCSLGCEGWGEQGGVEQELSA